MQLDLLRFGLSACGGGSPAPPDNHTRSHPRRPSKRAVRFAEAYYYAACMLRRVRAVTNIDVEPESISWVTGPGGGARAC